MASPASPATDRLEFENLPHVTNIQISKPITTPKGLKYRAVATKNRVSLISEAPGGFTVVLTGPTVAELSVGGVISGILDGIGDALNGLVGVLKKLGCTPVTTVHQTFDSNGHMTSQDITSTCTPN
jgi:hypothetical protein